MKIPLTRLAALTLGVVALAACEPEPLVQPPPATPPPPPPVVVEPPPPPPTATVAVPPPTASPRALPELPDVPKLSPDERKAREDKAWKALSGEAN